MLKLTESDRRAIKALWVIKGEEGTWQATADAISKPGHKVNVGLVHQVVNGKRHAPNSLLKALGLPMKMVLGPACPACGEAHLPKVCPTKRKPSGRPRRNWKRYGLMTTGILMSLINR